MPLRTKRGSTKRTRRAAARNYASRQAKRDALIAQTPALEHILQSKTRWEKSKRAPDRVINRMRDRHVFEKSRRPIKTSAYLDAVADAEGMDPGSASGATTFRSIFGEGSPRHKPQIRYIGTPISPNRGRSLDPPFGYSK